MPSTTSWTAMAAYALSLLSLASPGLADSTATSDSQSGVLMPTPSARPTGMSAITYLGCYGDAHPMQDHGPYNFQSSGNCQPICWLLGKAVMGLTSGTNCWCGDYIPDASKITLTNSTCNTPCKGIDTEMCGGDNLWSVYLTGYSANKVAHWDLTANAPVTSSIAYLISATSTPSAATTVKDSTVVVTSVAQATPTTTSSKSHSGSSNVAGIAAGIVVGVVVLCGIVLGAFFFLRQRKRKAIEEEHRRAAAVSEFVKGGRGDLTRGSSLNDSRLDPEVMGQRRDSVGSIADNQDYSRRILKVTNA